ncbi:Protein of unknown function [Sphingobium faniae]|nr:Protein of unknown function [Sphingobium faniae]
MSEWQPIETLGDDVEEAVLLFSSDEQVVDAGFWDNLFQHFYTLQCGAWQKEDVSHWMPLPEPPK